MQLPPTKSVKGIKAFNGLNARGQDYKAVSLQDRSTASLQACEPSSLLAYASVIHLILIQLFQRFYQQLIFLFFESWVII